MHQIEINSDGLSPLFQATDRLQSRFQTLGQHIDQAFERFDTVPGAVSQLDAVFIQMGQSLSSALGQAARSGELDFRSMAEAILADFARIAAQAILTRNAIAGGSGPTVNLNMSLGAGVDAGSVIGAAGDISSAVARAAALGGRFL